MPALWVRLFGRLSVQRDERTLDGLYATKVQELFCYLLIYRDRPHPRETLAGLLWADSSTAQAKKYLRQTLWQLQSALNGQSDPVQGSLLLIEPEWIHLNSKAGLWLDVAALEDVFAVVQGVPGQQLDANGAQRLQDTVKVYRGDLLEGWYQDWCLYERERLQNIYLAMLDKLMGYCEAHQEFETGLTYGTRILRYDRARERTHRQLMRLHYLARDRTAALRQYERCVASLKEELGVGPAQSTIALYEQIRADQLEGSPPVVAEEAPRRESAASPLRELLGRLKNLRGVLADAQHQLEQDIHRVEVALKGQR